MPRNVSVARSPRPVPPAGVASPSVAAAVARRQALDVSSLGPRTRTGGAAGVSGAVASARARPLGPDGTPIRRSAGGGAR